MTAHFNHTIIASTDASQMAEFYIDLLEAERGSLPGGRSRTSASAAA